MLCRVGWKIQIAAMRNEWQAVQNFSRVNKIGEDLEMFVVVANVARSWGSVVE
jgi:hypothetical protein